MGVNLIVNGPLLVSNSNKVQQHLYTKRSVSVFHKNQPFCSSTNSLNIIHLPKQFPICKQNHFLSMAAMNNQESVTAVDELALTKDVSLNDLKQKMADFAKERDWDQFHTPRNLLLALVGEVGELSEIFQWKGEVERGIPNWEQDEKLHLGEELSDVLLYLVRLSDICGIDLGKAALRKLDLNAKKYPIHLCKGSSNKQTQVRSTKN